MWALFATEPGRRVRAVRVTSRALAGLSAGRVDRLNGTIRAGLPPGVQVAAAQGTVPPRGALPTEVRV